MIIIWPKDSTNIKPGRINFPYRLTRLYEVVDYLNKKSINVDYYDMEMQNGHFNGLIYKIINNKIKNAIFYVSLENITNVILYIDYIKKIDQEIKCFVYGEVPGISIEYFEDYNIDGVFIQNKDIECTFEDIYKYENSIIKYEDICGMAFIKDHKIYKINEGKYMNIDLWGFPHDKYFSYEELRKKGEDDQITFTISKGCPFGCEYCLTKKVEGNVLRKRKIDDIINYINQSEHTKFKFFSAIFTADKNYVKELCKRIISNGKKISWSCCTRADMLLDEEMIKLMKQSGCYKISVGIESLSNSDLNQINKSSNNDIIIKSIKLVKKYNIVYKGLIMIGIPNQNRNDLYNTIDTLYKLDVSIRPTAYTPLFDIKKGMKPEEILKYNKWTYYNKNSNISEREILILVNDISKYNILKGDNND